MKKLNNKLIFLKSWLIYNISNKLFIEIIIRFKFNNDIIINKISIKNRYYL